MAEEKEPKGETLRKRVLDLVTAKPNLDDVEIADELGEDPFLVSYVLGLLKREGLVADA